jgi:hypothetical protein
VQQSDHFPTQKQSLPFGAVTVFGVAALLLGLALIIFAHYHERAYVFLGLGAAGFIGGIAGIVEAESKVKATLSYGMIALGMVGNIVGLNYLTNIYGLYLNQSRGDIVIALSIVAILAGIIVALNMQPKGGIVAFTSVIMLGVIASIGIVVLIVGTICLVVLEYQGAYDLLGAGTVCLVGGITCGIFARSRVRATSR